MPITKIFNLDTYKDYLMTQQNMSLEQATLLIELNQYYLYDGVPLTTLLEQGHLLLAKWCIDREL